MTLIAVTIGVVALAMFAMALVSITKGRLGSAALFALAFFVLGGAAGAFLASS